MEGHLKYLGPTGDVGSESNTSQVRTHVLHYFRAFNHKTSLPSGSRAGHKPLMLLSSKTPQFQQCATKQQNEIIINITPITSRYGRKVCLIPNDNCPSVTQIQGAIHYCQHCPKSTKRSLSLDPSASIRKLFDHLVSADHDIELSLSSSILPPFTLCALHTATPGNDRNMLICSLLQGLDH